MWGNDVIDHQRKSQIGMGRAGTLGGMQPNAPGKKGQIGLLANNMNQTKIGFD